MEIPKKPSESIDSLRLKLEKSGIDTSQWGTGKAKTLEHLLKEIEEGETVLVTGEKGELLRKVIVARANIYYLDSKANKFRLKEERQVFKDGRERKRDLGITVSEKIKLNEDPKEAMIRGIQEEPGISGEIDLTEMGTDEETIESPSYPGLLSQYIRHNFETILNKEQFKPEGYLEEQDGISTYFIWEKVE